MKYVVLLFALAHIVAAQNTPNVQAETSGTCSPIVQGNQGKVQIECDTAMDQATQKKFLTLLNAILKDTKGADSTNKKLDDILKYVTRLQPVNITQGSGSITQFGGTGNSATVINQKPPIPMIHWEPEDRPDLHPQGNPMAFAKFWLDGTFDNPRFAVLCDRPCKALGVSVPGYNQSCSATVPNHPNLGVVVIMQPSPFPGKVKAEISVRSQDTNPVKILAVYTFSVVDDHGCDGT